MKTKTISCCCALALSVPAFAASHAWHYNRDIIDGGASCVLTQWRIVDKGWRPHVRKGKTWQGEFVPYDEHYEKWVIVETNTISRPVSVPARSVYRDTVTNLTAEVVALTPDANELRKARKASEKAKKKDAKNFSKWLDATTKARKKSSDEMTLFYDAILGIATNSFSNPKN